MELCIYDSSKKAYRLKKESDIFEFNTNLTYQQYVELPDPPYTLIYKNIKLGARSTNICPSSIIRLQANLPEEEWIKIDNQLSKTHIPVIGPKIIIHYLPPSAELMIKAFKTTCFDENAPKSQLASDGKDLLSWLSLFCIYGKLFTIAYDEYD
jgi:hypothetical protein